MDMMNLVAVIVRSAANGSRTLGCKVSSRAFAEYCCEFHEAVGDCLLQFKNTLSQLISQSLFQFKNYLERGNALPDPENEESR